MDYAGLNRLTSATGVSTVWEEADEYGDRDKHHYTLGMSYNSIHNITHKTRVQKISERDDNIWELEERKKIDWAYNYTGSQPHAPSKIGKRHYSYDANGNQTGYIRPGDDGHLRKIWWDEENRIKAVYDGEVDDEFENGDSKKKKKNKNKKNKKKNKFTDPEVLDDDDIVRYVYNDQGQRVLKLQEDEEDNTAYVNPYFIVRGDDVHGGTNAASTRMYRSSGHDGFYSKHVMIGSTRIASRLVAKDDVQGRTNVAGAGRAGAIDYDDDEDKATFFYHSDHLGSTGYVSDHNGKLAEHIAYFPFGESWIEQQRDEMCMDARMSRAQGCAGATMDDLSPEKWRFTGKELDSETGLYYFGARYYDPRTSVWQSADPILGKYLPNSRGDNKNLPGMGGVFNSMNLGLYTYTHQNSGSWRFKKEDIEMWIQEQKQQGINEH